MIGDIEDIDVIRRALFPWFSASVETQRNWFRTLPEAARAQRLVAVVDGVVVGFAMGGLNHHATEPGQGSVNLIVHPDHQGRGIAKELLDLVEGHMRGIGVERAQGFALDSPESLDWVKRQGYEVGANERWSMVDPLHLPPAPQTPANVEIVTAAQAGPEATHAIEMAFLDEPGDVQNNAIPFDEWVERFWRSPDFDAEVSMVALVDGKPAASTLVEVNRATGRAMSSGTGTLREYRGMGLAKLLKSASLRRAASSGVTAAFTCNDYSNVPMLAVNDWLGYRVVGATRSVLKAL